MTLKNKAELIKYI